MEENIMSPQPGPNAQWLMDNIQLYYSRDFEERFMWNCIYKKLSKSDQDIVTEYIRAIFNKDDL